MLLQLQFQMFYCFQILFYCKMTLCLIKAGKRGGGGGADWLGGPKILVKCLVMGATVKRAGGHNA